MKKIRRAVASSNVVPRQASIAGVLSEAATLCATLTVLAFQVPRMDGYDAEKAGLLGLCVAVILGGGVVSIIRNWRSGSDLLAKLRTPLYAAVLAWLGIALASTLFSLSPALSLWGVPSRAQGSLTLCLYVILFFQAASLSRMGRAALIPFLLAAAVPLCFWTILLALRHTDRVALGGTTGNPDFLSSWLVMVMLYCAPQLCSRVRLWTRPFNTQQRATIALYAVILLSMMVTLVLNTSRGALLGLGVGGLFMLLAVAALAHQRRLLAGLGAMALVSLLIYGSLSVWRRVYASATGSDSASRLIALYDPVRIELWRGAASVVAQQSEPLLSIDRQPDPLVMLRPLFGYGPETSEQVQSRIGDIFTEGSAVNSFHNQIFDTVITEGWIGLLIWLGVFGAAFYGGLRALGLLRDRDKWQWIVWLIGGTVIGAGFAMLLVAPETPAAVLPLGAGLGAALGLLAWTARQGFSSGQAPVSLLAFLADERRVIVLSVLAVLSAQWVDNQVGFSTASTQPLWWILLGVLAGTLTHAEPERIAAPAEPETWAWLAATGGAGLFAIHSFSGGLQSQSLRIEVGANDLPILLLALLFIGIAGSALSNLAKRSRLVIPVLAVVAAWAVFFGLKTALVGASGTLFDRAFSLSDPAHLADDLSRAAQILSYSGIILVIMALGLITVASHDLSVIKARLAQSAASLIAVIALFLVSGTLYSAFYTGSVLHNIGVMLTERPSSAAKNQELQIADAALNAASAYQPADVYIPLHRATTLISALNLQAGTPQMAARSQIAQLLSGIFQQQPFFVNTLEWRNFSETNRELLAVSAPAGGTG